MSDDLFSFAVDGPSAAAAFPRVQSQHLILAALAQIEPDPAWEGCLVYEGESPLDTPPGFSVATLGPGADAVQERLVEAFERLGVRIVQIFEGGPAERTRIARVRGGVWSTA